MVLILAVYKLLLNGEVIEEITAGSPMVGTPINLVRRPINLGLIKDLIPAAICSIISLFNNSTQLVSVTINNKLEEAT